MFTVEILPARHTAATRDDLPLYAAGHRLLIYRRYDRPTLRSPERARTAYLAAACRFVDALAGYVAAGVPLAPRGSDRELPPWSRADVAALLELRAALHAVISTRRSYDAGRRPR